MNDLRILLDAVYAGTMVTDHQTKGDAMAKGRDAGNGMDFGGNGPDQCYGQGPALGLPIDTLPLKFAEIYRES